jgi:hypothetical protein
MALMTSIGGFFRQQPGSRVTWTAWVGNNLDRRAMVLRPNISDDILGTAALVVVEEGILEGDFGVQYTVTIDNRGPQSVRYNLNLWDPL